MTRDDVIVPGSPEAFGGGTPAKVHGYDTHVHIDRLRTVLNETVEIHGKGNFPTISARLIDIISCVREKLR
ncbi:hypothetical protein ANCCAN_00722 [Ancylostoma caninum]|uniref:polynucleotide adenylyltransferase n=1 Tax=Ancylostoma caninum TaxID=29170 RepID=A0A368HBU0_ANCCA|nr:hypothetical protein ANCCAN_00722 [Ancylostoma caninum]